VSIRNVFLNITGNILLKGMLIGNGVGLLLCYIQYTYHVIALDPLNYYMSYVPISVEWQHLLLVNGVVFSISLFVLLFPAYFVARKIQIVDAIRFN
jgi:lipoprotein-releasing system permease protein